MNFESTTTDNFQTDLSEKRVKNYLTPPGPAFNSEELNQRVSTSGSDQDEIDLVEEIPEKDILNYKTYNTKAEAIYCCKFDPKDEFVAAGTSTGAIHVFSVYGSAKTFTGQNFCVFNDSHRDPITSLKWHPQKDSTTGSSILTSSTSDGTITQWDIVSGKTLFSFKEKNENVCLDYNREGTLFATGGKDKKVRVYDDATKKLKQTLEAITWLSPGHTNRIFSLKFHPEDPNVLISAGWDRHVYLWDMRTSRPMGSIYGPSTISGESLDVKGNLVLTGSYRGRDQLELWDFGSRKKVSGVDWEFGYAKENAYVFSCQFSKFNDESIIAGCSRLNQLKLFDRRDQNRDYAQIDNKNSAVFCTDFANTNDFFCYAGYGGAVNVSKIILKHDPNM